MRISTMVSIGGETYPMTVVSVAGEITKVLLDGDDHTELLDDRETADIIHDAVKSYIYVYEMEPEYEQE